MIKTTVRELGKVVTGHTPPTSKREYYGNSYLFLKPTDMVIGQKYTYVTEEGYSALGAEKYKTSLIPKGSTCVVCIGTLGEKMSMAHCDLFTNQSVNSIIPGDNYDPHYVFYLLKHNLHKVKALNKGTASGREFVSKSTFLDMEIDVIEDIHSQKRIGEILSAYDDLIENNQRQIRLLEEAAQRLYKEWFVDLRFPGYENTPIVDGVPEGWGYYPLQEVIKYHDTLRKPLSGMERASMQGKYRYYGAAGILDYVNAYLFDGTFLLLGEDGTVITDDGYPVLQYVTGQFWVNNHAHVLTGKGIYTTEFIYMMFSHTRVSDVVTGVAQPKISQGRLSAKQVLLPTEALVNRFHTATKPFFEKKLLLEMQVRELSEARDRLLPKLMSGEMEV